MKLHEQAQASVQEFDESGAVVANGSITYSSSDLSVATVSDAGVITPVAPGTATITATDGSNGLSDSKSITVEADAPPPPSPPPVATKLVLTIGEPFQAAVAKTVANSSDAEPVS